MRGGYGIFNARLINSTIYNALAQTGNPNGQFQTPNLTPTNGPLFPQILRSSTGVTPNVIYFDPHFELPQIHQADLTVDQDLGWNTVLSVSWLGSFGREFPNFVDTNLPNPVPVTYTVVNSNPALFAGLPNNAQYTANLYGYAVSSAGKTTTGEVLRPNTAYGAITDIVSNINSTYNALVIQVQHRLSHHVQFQSSYTWAHDLDYNENNTTFTSTSSVLDPRNFHLEYGNGAQNIPNRVIATAIVSSPWQTHGLWHYFLNDYQLAPSFSAQNGAPYTASITGNPTTLVTSGFSTGFATGVSSGYTGTGGSSRIPGLERNTFEQPRTILLDLRGSKRVIVRERYSLEFLAEAFNIANHQNVTAVNSTAYTLGTTTTNGVVTNTLTQFLGSTFGAPTNSNNNNIYSPRQIQLGVRLQF